MTTKIEILTFYNTVNMNEVVEQANSILHDFRMKRRFRNDCNGHIIRACERLNALQELLDRQLLILKGEINEIE